MFEIGFAIAYQTNPIRNAAKITSMSHPRFLGIVIVVVFGFGVGDVGRFG